MRTQNFNLTLLGGVAVQKGTLGYENYGRLKSPLTSEEMNTLSNYNGEVSRGLLHTKEWTEKMMALQVAFDEQYAGLERCGPFVILPPS